MPMAVTINTILSRIVSLHRVVMINIDRSAIVISMVSYDWLYMVNFSCVNNRLGIYNNSFCNWLRFYCNVCIDFNGWLSIANNRTFMDQVSVAMSINSVVG